MYIQITSNGSCCDTSGDTISCDCDASFFLWTWGESLQVFAFQLNTDIDRDEAVEECEHHRCPRKDALSKQLNLKPYRKTNSNKKVGVVYCLKI